MLFIYSSSFMKYCLRHILHNPHNVVEIVGGRESIRITMGLVRGSPKLIDLDVEYFIVRK
ncbi:MAG: hypothetical protein QXM55_06020 [Ignisphaera sp.]